jgi:hypothetical protein
MIITTMMIMVMVMMSQHFRGSGRGRSGGGGARRLCSQVQRSGAQRRRRGKKGACTRASSRPESAPAAPRSAAALHPPTCPATPAPQGPLPPGRSSYPADTPRPSPRTKQTRLVPSPVLTGHDSSLSEAHAEAVARAGARGRRAAMPARTVHSPAEKPATCEGGGGGACPQRQPPCLFACLHVCMLRACILSVTTGNISGTRRVRLVRGEGRGMSD